MTQSNDLTPPVPGVEVVRKDQSASLRIIPAGVPDLVLHAMVVFPLFAVLLALCYFSVIIDWGNMWGLLAPLWLVLGMPLLVLLGYMSAEATRMRRGYEIRIDRHERSVEIVCGNGAAERRHENVKGIFIGTTGARGGTFVGDVFFHCQDRGELVPMLRYRRVSASAEGDVIASLSGLVDWLNTELDCPSMPPRRVKWYQMR